MLNAGRLRHRVIIQTPTESVDVLGGISKSWATHATVWAEVQPLSGRELLEAAKTTSRVSHRVTIRELSTVTPKMRISYDSRYLYIESVRRVNNELGEVMELDCTEAV